MRLPLVTPWATTAKPTVATTSTATAPQNAARAPLGTLARCPIAGTTARMTTTVPGLSQPAALRATQVPARPAGQVAVLLAGASPHSDRPVLAALPLTSRARQPGACRLRRPS